MGAIIMLSTAMLIALGLLFIVWRDDRRENKEAQKTKTPIQ